MRLVKKHCLCSHVFSKSEQPHNVSGQKTETRTLSSFERLFFSFPTETSTGADIIKPPHVTWWNGCVCCETDIKVCCVPGEMHLDFSVIIHSVIWCGRFKRAVREWCAVRNREPWASRSLLTCLAFRSLYLLSLNYVAHQYENHPKPSSVFLLILFEFVISVWTEVGPVAPGPTVRVNGPPILAKELNLG